MKTVIFILSLLFTGVAFGQSPAKMLLKNGRLHVGNGTIMESALIGIENGKISFVKNALASSYETSEWDTIIDLKGQEIYPGFVAPNSTLGLTEIDAVRATRDYNEVGALNPHVRAQIAYNVESKVISTVRSNGILITQATPKGGRISGTSAVMKMDGWNWEDATINGEDGIHLSWPSSVLNRWRREDKSDLHDENYEKHKHEIYAFFESALAYSKTSQQKEELFDARFEAMRACFKGKKRVYIHADELQQIIDVIEFARHFDLKYPVLVGGYDAPLAARRLVDAKIPVMITRPHSLPENEDDAIDYPYALASKLKSENVKFCIQNEGDMEAMNARNIPFLAGTAMAYGLSEEEAVSAISLWSCEIMGIDDAYGSIEKGKSATLFASKGNALDMMTNQVSFAIIDGEFVQLLNSQEALFKKYGKKYKVTK